MSTTTLRILLAIMTLVAGVESWIIYDEMGRPIEPDAIKPGMYSCVNTDRYNIPAGTPSLGGDNISITIKDAQIAAYNASISTNQNAFKFCVISKKAIDEIFTKDLKANAILCEMAKSKEDPKINTLIFTGIKSMHYEITDNDPNSKIFYARYYCPRKCQIE